MTHYGTYELSTKQRLWAIIIGCVICFGAVWLVCQEAIVALAVSPIGFLYPKIYRESLRRSRKNKLRLQFKEMLQVLSSLLSAGRSVENAFLSLETDLALIIGDLRSDMLREIRTVANRLHNGESLDPLLDDFARRSDLEEARSFAEAFGICKRAGGDMVEIVRRTSQIIGEKLEVEMEISVLMAQKRFESRIMMAMPFAFIGFLGLFAPEYMSPLHQGVGWAVLGFCLLLLLACCWWMLRIMGVEV